MDGRIKSTHQESGKGKGKGKEREKKIVLCVVCGVLWCVVVRSGGDGGCGVCVRLAKGKGQRAKSKAGAAGHTLDGVLQVCCQ